MQCPLYAGFRPESHLGAVELPEFDVAEDSVDVVIHRLEADLFVPEDLADEDAALVRADVTIVVDRRV